MAARKVVELLAALVPFLGQLEGGEGTPKKMNVRSFGQFFVVLRL